MAKVTMLTMSKCTPAQLLLSSLVNMDSMFMSLEKHADTILPTYNQNSIYTTDVIRVASSEIFVQNNNKFPDHYRSFQQQYN